MSSMSVVEPWRVPISGPAAPAAPPPGDRVAFTGDRGAYWRLMIRGAVLLAVTLGIYRFWLYTDMRRFLWANTEIDGESLEYTGTPAELLLGFLMAIGILVPIYGLIFVGTLELGMISDLSGLLGFAVLAAFGQYAIYRARRYRLTRTALRGVRFHQSGSGFAYALRAVLWWIPNLLTLGLTYPWAAASLERYKMRHTHYGEVGGRFVGTGSRLFVRGIAIWIAIVVPVVAGLVTAVAMVDWAAVGHVLSSAKSPDAMAALGRIKGLAAAAAIGGGGIALSGLFAVTLYPAFQAIVMRWWLAGLRLGAATVASDLRMSRYYGAWLRYLVYLIGFSAAILVVGGMAGSLIAAVAAAMGVDLKTATSDFSAVASAAGVAFYVLFILAASTIFQVVVTFRLWQVAAESVTVANLASLENVRAGDASATAVGEGLADALVGAGAI